MGDQSVYLSQRATRIDITIASACMTLLVHLVIVSEAVKEILPGDDKRTVELN